MEKDNVALTPPMGWNSWDCYGPAVNEEQLLGNAQYGNTSAATSSGASPPPGR